MAFREDTRTRIHQADRFIRQTVGVWRPFDRGRLGGALAYLEDDDWRLEQRLDWSLSPTDKAQLGLAEEDIVWAVAHYGVTTAFVETEDAIMVVYVNRRSSMNMGSS